jgi:hypothetical protein
MVSAKKSAMQWMEIIRVIGAQRSKGELESGMKPYLSDLKSAEGLQRALLMFHNAYASDFAVVLSWENECIPVKTREGLFLADNLRQFGSVDHAVWTVSSAVSFSKDKKAKSKAGEYHEHRAVSVL